MGTLARSTNNRTGTPRAARGPRTLYMCACGELAGAIECNGYAAACSQQLTRGHARPEPHTHPLPHLSASTNPRAHQPTGPPTHRRWKRWQKLDALRTQGFDIVPRMGARSYHAMLHESQVVFAPRGHGVGEHKYHEIAAAGAIIRNRPRSEPSIFRSLACPSWCNVIG